MGSRERKSFPGLHWLEIIIISMIGLAIGMMSGCSDTGCLENRSSIPYAGFYSYQTGRPVVIDSMEVGGVGAPADTLLMTASDKYSNLYLPFRFEKTSTSFFFRYVAKELNYPQLYDTISFDYESMPFFASPECGAMYRYQITRMTYTTHLIDSVAITDSLITNTDVERIKIFFRTAEIDEGGTAQ